MTASSAVGRCELRKSRLSAENHKDIVVAVVGDHDVTFAVAVQIPNRNTFRLFAGRDRGDRRDRAFAAHQE